MSEALSSLCVATPMYGGMCSGLYTKSIGHLTADFTQRGIPVFIGYLFNESLITRARNTLVYLFLKTPCTHLIFIDGDIGFQPKDVLSLMEADKDIIGGAYPRKSIDWEGVGRAADEGITAPEALMHRGLSYVLAELAEGTYERSTPIEARYIGTGFLMIKRGVFEALADKVPTYSADCSTLGEDLYCKEVREYFATSIDQQSRRLLSEDYHFCKLAMENGFQVHAAPWVDLAHVGTYTFGSKRAQQC